MLLIVALATLLCLPPAALAQQGDANPAELASDGWAALEEQRFGDALAAFTAASEQVPDEPTFWFGGGLAAYMLGRTEDAEVLLQRVLDLEPWLADAAWLLGELYYHAGRVQEAVATYEAALGHLPDDPDFADRLEDWKRENQLQDRFYVSRGAHFRVLFEGPADDALARRIVEMLEAAYWRVGGELRSYPPQAITVVLYTQEQFQDITRSPAWAAGVYDGQIRMPVRGALDRRAELERVLTHEFVHALVAMLGSRTVPVWLNEGLATVFEPGGLNRATEVLASATSQPSLRDLHDSFAGLSGARAHRVRPERGRGRPDDLAARRSGHRPLAEGSREGRAVCFGVSPAHRSSVRRIRAHGPVALALWIAVATRCACDVSRIRSAGVDREADAVSQVGAPRASDLELAEESGFVSDPKHEVEPSADARRVSHPQEVHGRTGALVDRPVGRGELVEVQELEVDARQCHAVASTPLDPRSEQKLG